MLHWFGIATPNAKPVCSLYVCVCVSRPGVGPKGVPTTGAQHVWVLFGLWLPQVAWRCVVGFVAVTAPLRDCNNKCQNLHVHCVYVQADPGTQGIIVVVVVAVVV